MTPDEAVALSLAAEIPRPGLTERLRADDPELVERARALLPAAATIRERALAQAVEALPWNDPRFPALLLSIPDCPPAVWYRGDLSCFDSLAVGIVGSRAASSVAVETARRLASELAARGVTVVSGLARGVDSAAHRGALETGRTIAVLGSGLDRVYPAEHVALADAIVADGLVMSEYPPGTAPLPFHFPMRNRLISGLSRAVVVIEASEKSGSLITARCALEQGREVMAVPGNVLTGRNRGGHALLRDGAAIVERADDVMMELGLLGSAPAGESGTNETESAASADPVLAGMQAGVPYELDDLAAATGLDAARLLPRIMQLELSGVVRRLEGGRFIRSA